MNVFDKEFYPTPDEVIARMVEPYAERLATATILEPSAGSGAIMDFITEKGLEKEVFLKNGMTRTVTYTASKQKIHTVEHNPELQMLLQGKGYRLVASDFLTYQPDTRYNLILMNPPFSSGVKHLLHAWEILRGGDIACLMNAESILNPYTSERGLLKAIIEKNGSVEYLGPVFSHSDHPTDVEVALVRLHKESEDKTFDLNLDGFVMESMPDFKTMTSENGALEQSSRLDAFIRSWDLAKAAAINYIKAYEKLHLYMSAFLNTDDRDNGRNVITELSKCLTRGTSMEDAYNFFIEEGKKSAWNVIFSQINLGKYMTSKLQEKLYAFRDGQASMAITKENIQNLFQYIMFNIKDIMDSSVSEVYDMLTRYYKDNTSFTEGWKTNKQFKCNRKVILPNIAESEHYPGRYREYFTTTYYADRNLEDIDKAMCWLAGRNFDDLTGTVDVPGQGKTPSPLNSTLHQALLRIRVGDQGWHESAFFRIKAFKKGTVHLEFKEESLWAKFNQVVNKEKNLIGSGEAA